MEEGEDVEEEKEEGLEDEEEVKIQPKPMLRRSSRSRVKVLRKVTRENVGLDESLANLAGYSLVDWGSIQKVRQESKRQVSFLEWQNVAHFSKDHPSNLVTKNELCPLSDYPSQVSRKLDNSQIQSQTCASIISQLDAQLLPKSCNGNSNCIECPCRDGMERIPLCATYECKLCVLKPKHNWL